MKLRVVNNQLIFSHIWYYICCVLTLITLSSIETRFKNYIYYICIYLVWHFQKSVPSGLQLFCNFFHQYCIFIYKLQTFYIQSTLNKLMMVIIIILIIIIMIIIIMLIIIIIIIIITIVILFIFLVKKVRLRKKLYSSNQSD